MSTEIEKQIDTGLREAMRAEMDKVPALEVLPIESIWLAREDGAAEQKIPGIWINTQPYIPLIFTANAINSPGGCAVTVQARGNQTDDQNRAVLSLLWGVVRDVCYKGAFSFGGGVTLDGRVVKSADVGLDDHGVRAQVVMDVNVSVT